MNKEITTRATVIATLALCLSSVATAQKTPTQAFQKRINDALSLQSSDPAKARSALDGVIFDAHAAGDHAAEAFADEMAGYITLALGKPKEALEYLQLALPLSIQVGNRAYQAIAYEGFGNVCAATGEDAKALENFKLALPIFQELHHADDSAMMMQFIAMNYALQGFNGLAREWAERALAEYKTVSGRTQMASVQLIIGDTYTAESNYDHAIESYQAGLALTDQVENYFLRAILQNNLAIALDKAGRREAAIAAQQAALGLRIKMGDKRGQAESLGNIARIYQELGKFKQALEYVKQALEHAEALGDQGLKGHLILSIASLYASMGDATQAKKWAYLVQWQDRLYNIDPHDVADVYASIGDLATAERLYGESVKFRQASPGAAAMRKEELEARGTTAEPAPGVVASRTAAVNAAAGGGTSRKFRENAKDVALLVATDDYSDPKLTHLNNCVRDAEALADELKTVYGYSEVNILKNPTKTQVRAAINSLRQATPGADDELLIYFAGHGFYDDGLEKDGCLLFTDAKMDDPDTRLNYTTLSGYLDNLPYTHVLLCLDACFGGSFVKSVRDRLGLTRGVPETLTKLTPEQLIQRKFKFAPARRVIYSGEREVADGPVGGHSPFMDALLGVLRDYESDEPVITMRSLMSKLERYTAFTAEDWYFGHNESASDFLLIRK